MRVFLTGATGFIGRAVLSELLKAGHQVIGLTRSAEGAHSLAAAGAEAHHGTLEDLASIRSGAEGADAVIHAAFDHDFSRFAENCEKDRRVIGALGEVLKDSGRPLLITSGIGMGGAGDGQPAREDVFNDAHPNPRIASERAGNDLLDAGVNLAVMRLPQVHDTRKQGLITPLIAIFREKGVASYIGEGRNRWSAGHLNDVARLYRLAIEAAEPGARYHAVGEEGVEIREIVEALARGLGISAVSIPLDKAAEHFGWMAMFAGADMAASSVLTQARLGWRPEGPGLIADLDAMRHA
ncbi:nucleoside-diphosphate-sugar epimerase [Azospirillum agricola]|uniref:SDR family oxidoreductase n=1 Tax=Azospirillum agricola TaxID=1720247 RepID=UPI001AE6A062|nr:SDR family oxidoreductase [Azospirillum agricola]MBP2227934.1 nucleoside-diphosphate-sugar epimerase [Azospirillum agricola]